MLIEEAIWLGKQLKKFSSEELSPLINIGSGTSDFRKKIQPHIHNYIFKPLEDRNIKVLHIDLKEESGIDYSGDIFLDNVQNYLKTIGPKAVICSNLIEHICTSRRNDLPKILHYILDANGYLFVTVPFSCPLHLDPIDTYYRPSTQDLIELFKQYELVDSKLIISSRSFMQDLLESGILGAVKNILRLLIPYKYNSWKSSAHRWLWLFRPYKVSCVIFKKSS